MLQGTFLKNVPLCVSRNISSKHCSQARLWTLALHARRLGPVIGEPTFRNLPRLGIWTGQARLHQGRQVNSIMSLETVLLSLAACKIDPKGSLAHAATTTDPASWTSALERAPSHDASTPSSFKLTKTLVFKPKTAKSAAPTPLIVIAREETDTRATNALGKQLGLKELRLATDDLIKDVYGAEKSACTSIFCQSGIWVLV